MSDMDAGAVVAIVLIVIMVILQIIAGCAKAGERIAKASARSARIASRQLKRAEIQARRDERVRKLAARYFCIKCQRMHGPGTKIYVNHGEYKQTPPTHQPRAAYPTPWWEKEAP